MSDGNLSSPPGPTPYPEVADPRVRFTTHSREEVSLYGTPKEELGPTNVNSSR